MVFASVAEAQPFLETFEKDPNMLFNSHFTSTYGATSISHLQASLVPAGYFHSSETTFYPTPSDPDDSSAIQLRAVSSMLRAVALAFVMVCVVS